MIILSHLYYLYSCSCFVIVQMFDDGIHITPFNMKEEMEDGFFDRDGNYFEKKDPNRVEDSWLQGVDWDKVGD